MLVPFGTHVLDKDGKSVGTVSRLVLHPDSREVSAIVVHQGIVNRREIVVPLSKVASFGDEVRLSLSTSELAGFDLFGAPSLKPMPDHWPMPAGLGPSGIFRNAASEHTETPVVFGPAATGQRTSTLDSSIGSVARFAWNAFVPPLISIAGDEVWPSRYCSTFEM